MVLLPAAVPLLLDQPACVVADATAGCRLVLPLPNPPLLAEILLAALLSPALAPRLAQASAAAAPNCCDFSLTASSLAMPRLCRCHLMDLSYCCHRWLWSSRAQATTAWWAPLALPCLLPAPAAAAWLPCPLLAAAAAAWPPCLPPAAATAACLPCSELLGGVRRRGQGRGRWRLLGLNQLCLHHDTGAGRVAGTLLRLALHRAAAGKQEQQRERRHSCIRQGFQPSQALQASLPIGRTESCQAAMLAKRAESLTGSSQISPVAGCVRCSAGQPARCGGQAADEQGSLPCTPCRHAQLGLSTTHFAFLHAF